MSVCAAAAPGFAGGGRAENFLSGAAVVWPLTWEGCTLTPAPPGDAAEIFRRGFSGEFMEFSAVSAELAEEGFFPEAGRVLMRFARNAARGLHPSEDCFKGAGYRIIPAPMRIDRRGRRWSCFTGKKQGRAVFVRQCVISVPGEDLRAAETSELSWPDVSGWYWDTARPGAENPPTALAVTIVVEMM